MIAAYLNVEAYAAFVLSAPAFLADPAAAPFGDLDAHLLTEAHLSTHLSTLFPEVRPRGYLEVRSLDALDDCGVIVGTAAKWARLGHHVKLCSVTNGDIGHWQMAGGPLAQRRAAESAAVAKKLGVTSQVLDIHDGELEPTLENRRLITKIIREWKADLVISHRPWDYHPDHRYVGILVQRRGHSRECLSNGVAA